MEVGPHEIVRVRIEVSGRVQGVFYRDTIRRRAVELGVAGSAVNRSDGTVEVVFEGEKDSVALMMTAAREGSRGSEVTGLDILGYEEPAGLTGFTTG